MTAPILWLAVLAAQSDDTLLINGGIRVTNARKVELQILPARPASERWEIALSSEAGAPPAWQPLTVPLEFELTEPDGGKTIFARLRDPAGREGGPFRASIVLDRTPPEGKAEIPARVRPGTVVILSDVPDAVALQVAEPPREGDWIPYVRPLEWPLSAGTGHKTLVVRYRDEAGNTGAPLTLAVEVAEDAPDPGDAPGLRSVRIAPALGPREPRRVVLSMDARGMREMEIQIDGLEPLPREPFVAERLLDLGGSRGSRRVRVRLWDEAGTEHSAEAAFQEADLDRLEPVPVPLAGPSRWFAGLRGGLLFDAFDFDSVTTIGPRRLKPGTVGLARLEAGILLTEIFFAKVAVETARGEEIQSFTAELDLGVRIPLGGGFDFEAEAGLLASTLEVDLPGFGDFEPGVGFRGAAGVNLQLSESLQIGITAEFRDVGYEWSGDVVSGDREARTSGVGVVAGLSYRF